MLLPETGNTSREEPVRLIKAASPNLTASNFRVLLNFALDQNNPRIIRALFAQKNTPGYCRFVATGGLRELLLHPNRDIRLLAITALGNGDPSGVSPRESEAAVPS